MRKSELKSVLEAAMFTLGDAVSPGTLAAALCIGEEEVRDAVREMTLEKSRADSGVEIIEIDGCFQMRTKKETYDYLIKIVQTPKNYRLTDVQLETLSIIAYKQPVTRADIEKIRGVSSDYAINRLIEVGLVEERGRMDTPGKPILFGTTREFLRRFGLSDISDLPEVSVEERETFRTEAEEEAGEETREKAEEESEEEAGEEAEEEAEEESEEGTEEEAKEEAKEESEEGAEEEAKERP